MHNSNSNSTARMLMNAALPLPLPLLTALRTQDPEGAHSRYYAAAVCCFAVGDLLGEERSMSSKVCRQLNN